MTWSRGYAVTGFATVILLLLMIGSLLMISLGLIGLYLARIYDEVKARPRFVVADAVGFPADRCADTIPRVPTAPAQRIESVFAADTYSQSHPGTDARELGAVSKPRNPNTPATRDPARDFPV